MISYRSQLQKIGYQPGTAVSYRHSFASRPTSLRQAMRSMDAPQTKKWDQVADLERDEFWTDEVQGVAWDGGNWIFSCDANQDKPDVNDKAIYVFKGESKLLDHQWTSMIPYHTFPHLTAGKDSHNHYGQLTYYEGYVYVSHFYKAGPLEGKKFILVLKNENGQLLYSHWIELGKVVHSDKSELLPEFQAINPWDGCLYTCRGEANPNEFFIHDIQNGEWTGRRLTLIGGECQGLMAQDGSPLPVLVNLPSRVQGACFSPNGHLYIACDVRLTQGLGQFKAIAYFSALNGYLMGIIPVLAKKGDQEIEGVCYGNVSWKDGRSAQIHVILLVNRNAAIDNIFFKSFSTNQSELV